MGRKPRQESSTGLYHVIVRGNNKRKLFHQREDFEQYLQCLSRYLQKYTVRIHHYCLMSNHVHMLLWAEDMKGLSCFMHGVQRAYHHYYRKAYGWFGHLFQGRFKSLRIEEEGYLLDCGRYIERNPVRSHLVKEPSRWLYSSYRYYESGERNELLTPSVAYIGLAHNDKDRRHLYRNHVEATRPYEEVLDKRLVGR